jgi:hypothetical protein
LTSGCWRFGNRRDRKLSGTDCTRAILAICAVCGLCVIGVICVICVICGHPLQVTPGPKLSLDRL